MPLKLLKRTSKQYNVVSKSTFVISVTLLDNGIMECTLDADSTGNDCLHNISQRLGLHQPEFFGLRYISRGVPPRQRWIELEQPLKKQLEKYAEDSQLSLGVMFYVMDVNLLRDEMARYHYFLQLKSDVIDGKLNCSIDQAISLAAYSLQAEFGDYDPERHTIDYLRDFAILPKDLTSQQKYRDIDINIVALFEAVARQYGRLIGFPPPLAEIYYIMVAQQLDGYGQECYPAKDDAGNDILICVSVNGLVIRRRDWTHIAAFRWSDIKSLTGHKRVFNLESAQSQRTMQFHFTDAEVVKYVRKICLLQLTFQKESQKVEQQNVESQRVNNSNYAARASTVDSFDGPLHSGSHATLRNTPDLITPSPMTGIGSQYSLNNNFVQHSTLANYNSGFNLNILHNNSLPSSQYRHQLVQQQQAMSQHPFHRSLQELSGSNTQLHHGRPLTPIDGNMVLMSDMNAGVPMSHPHHSMNLNPNGTQDSDFQSLLPSYRPAPDYDTAVQLKYGHHQQHIVTNVHGNSIREVARPQQLVQVFYDTKPEDEEPIYQNEIVSKIHSIELRDSREAQQKRTPTPEIISQTRSQGQVSTEDSQVSYMYKPPPPYPGTLATPPPQVFEPPHYQVKSGGFVGITVTKPSSSFNTREDVLQQFSFVLQSGSFPSILTESTYTNSKGHNTGVQNSEGSTMSSYARSNQNSGTPSIIKELSKSMGSKLTRDFASPEKEGGLKNGASDSTPALPSSYCKNTKPIFSGTGELPLYRKPIDVNIMKEFQAIPKATLNPNFTTAMKRENSKRNRSPNILPYEDNSIHLSSSRQNPGGYINASPMSAQIGDRAWKYIVGQIPLSGNGPVALWQMIWEMDTKIIVTLERDSTTPFYPPENSPTITFADYQITDCKNGRLTSKASIARELLITFLPKKKQRRVWVLPYEDEWKDDVPVDTEHFLCFLEEVNSVQRKVSDDMSPLTVLCGTGAGRSGVFVLADLLLHAADAGHKIRCDNLLSELRTERMLLVTHPPQYAFVLDTLAKYLAQSRLI